MDNTSQVQAVFTTISTLTEKLQALLGNAALVAARCFPLPAVPLHSEGAAVESIPVEQVSDDDARRMAIRHYGGFTAHQDESTRIARRLPGVIVLSSSEKSAIFELVHIINQQKAIFASLVPQLGPTHEERHEVLHRLYPMMVALNVYRSIPITDVAVKSVRLSWTHKHAQKRVTKADIVKRLENAQVYGSDKTLNQQSFLEQLEQEFRIMSQIGDNDKLVTRRPLRVAPMANISLREEDSAGRIRYPITAHSPIICFHNNQDKLPVIGDLKGYETNQAPAVPAKYESILPRLHLFKYQA